MPGGGGREAFDIMQRDKNYAKRGDSLPQKRGLSVLWMLYVDPGWSWDVGEKEEASGPSIGELYTKAEKSMLLVPWILEEFL